MRMLVCGIVLVTIITLLACIANTSPMQLRKIWRRSLQDYFKPLTFWRTRGMRSDAFEAIYSSARALHEVGAINKATMRKYHRSCKENK